jgi:Rrf2 family transcriptional regulator, iron-sulfur cluster assembly transcription factor
VELTTKGRYAVTALADIAKFGRDGAVALSAIAERQQLPLAYLEQLFMALRRAELVESARGRSGGYRLARAAADITVSDVMRAVEEETRMTRCRDGANQCRGDQPCLTHDLWTALGEEIESFLTDVSLQDVIDGVPADKRTKRPTSKAGRAAA